ncbi:MAG: Transketolase, partial [uncultured Solirubrobacteraceae bacterium]
DHRPRSHHRPRSAQRRHDPDAVHGRGAAGQLGPPRAADGDGARRLRPLRAGAEARPAGPAVARPRPLPALRGARLDAALQRPAPLGLRPAARGAQEVPPVGLADPGPPRARPRAHHPGRRGHHGPARPGLRQRRRDGHGRGVPAPPLRPGRPGPLHVRDRLRRRPDGGRRLRGRLPRGPARPGPAHLPLRRQRHLPRRPDLAVVLRRGPRQALRGLRLAGPLRGRRERHRGDRGGDRGGQGRHGAADAHPRQVDHRLPLAEQAGLPEGPRRRPRRGRGPCHEGGHGLGSRRALPRARRRLRPLPPGRRARPGGARGVERALRGLPAGRRRPRHRVGRGLVGSQPPAARPRGRAAHHRVVEGQARHPGRGQGGHGGHVALRADDGRRRGGPLRVDQDGVPRRPRGALRARQAGPQRLLGRARARHGRRGERPLRARRDRPPVRLDVPAVRRLHARLHPPQRADPARRGVGLHARLRRARRGRPDPPARRAPRGAAGDPGHRGDPPGRRPRDRRGLARDPRGPRGPRRPRALPPGPGDPRRPLRGRPRRVRPARGRRARHRRHGRGGPHGARRGGPAREGRGPGAGRLHAVVGALRPAGRRLPGLRPARRPQEGLRGGRHLHGLVAVGRRLRGHRPLRRERPRVRGPRAPGHHARERRRAGARPAV